LGGQPVRLGSSMIRRSTVDRRNSPPPTQPWNLGYLRFQGPKVTIERLAHSCSDPTETLPIWVRAFGPVAGGPEPGSSPA
jgi:hypothetical protein